MYDNCHGHNRGSNPRQRISGTQRLSQRRVVLSCDPGSDTRMLWQLLGQLDPDEVLVQLPEWLAEERVGYVNGATPTAVVGRIERETEKAIRFSDSANARSLMKLVHRMHHWSKAIRPAIARSGRKSVLPTTAARLRSTRTRCRCRTSGFRSPSFALLSGDADEAGPPRLLCSRRSSDHRSAGSAKRIDAFNPDFL